MSDKSRHVFTVCVIGAESSGKTTLCTALSRHYKTEFVPEFAREYFSVRTDPSDWVDEDFVAVFKGIPHPLHGVHTHCWSRSQRRLIEQTLCRINGHASCYCAAREQCVACGCSGSADAVLFVDTCALATCIWSEYLKGATPAAVREFATAAVRPLFRAVAASVVSFVLFCVIGMSGGSYFCAFVAFCAQLTDHHIPYEADPLRYAPADAQRFHDFFMRELQQRGCRFVEVSGSVSDRVGQVAAALAPFLSPVTQPGAAVAATAD